MIYCIYCTIAYKTIDIKYLKVSGYPRHYKEGYQSGQMGRAVNPLTSVFESSNLSPSTNFCLFDMS